MAEVLDSITINAATCDALGAEVRRVWLHDKDSTNPATQARLDEIARIALAGQGHEVVHGTRLADLQQWASLARAAMHPESCFGDTAHQLPVANLLWQEKQEERHG